MSYTSHSTNEHPIVANEADATAFSMPEENTVIVDSVSTGRLGLRVSRLIRPVDGAVTIFAPPAARFNTTEVYHV